MERRCCQSGRSPPPCLFLLAEVTLCCVLRETVDALETCARWEPPREVTAELFDRGYGFVYVHDRARFGVPSSYLQARRPEPRSAAVVTGVT